MWGLNPAFGVRFPCSSNHIHGTMECWPAACAGWIAWQLDPTTAWIATVIFMQWRFPLELCFTIIGRPDAWPYIIYLYHAPFSLRSLINWVRWDWNILVAVIILPYVCECIHLHTWANIIKSLYLYLLCGSRASKLHASGNKTRY